jgi:glutamate racemase
MKNDNLRGQKIGIFDSGIGGASVYKEIKKLLPKERLIYLADTKNMPYGNKKELDIKNLSFKISKFLIKKNVKAIVIACNSISSTSKKFLEKKISVPIIDMITPTIAYILKNNFKNILVLSTFATFKSQVFEKKLKNIKVKTLPLPFLACLVEDNSKFINEYLDEYLQKEKNKSFDAIILACTHYILIKKIIKKKFDKKIKIIDPSKIVAYELKKILEKNDLLNLSENNNNDFFYVTENENEFKENLNFFLKIKINNLKKVSIF